MNQPSTFSSQRVFQVWRYSVSHGQLLLRSTKTAEFPTRVEVLFKSVAFMALPSLLDGLLVSECASADLPACLKAISVERPWYKLSSNGNPSYVAAEVFFVSEDELEYFDPSPLMDDSGL